MTFKATVDYDGRLRLGDAARRAGFLPGQVVEISVSKATGLLLLSLDDDPRSVEAHAAVLPPFVRAAITERAS